MPDLLQLAVFGSPISHSLSPRIHQLFGEQTGRAIHYQAIESTPAQLPARLAAFVQQGGVGANITVPLKQCVIGSCHRIDQVARQARAVNTLVAGSNGWTGYNTDGAGLLNDLDRLDLDPAGRRILIIGAGGATAGILAPLMTRKPALTCILNRRAERAEQLASKFEHLGPIMAGSLEATEDVADFDLLIQSTSAGHQGQLPPLSAGWLRSNAAVYDLNYGAAHEPVRRWASTHDLACHDGLGMLVAQAAKSFELWTGALPRSEPVLARLKR